MNGNCAIASIGICGGGVSAVAAAGAKHNADAIHGIAATRRARFGTQLPLFTIRFPRHVGGRVAPTLLSANSLASLRKFAMRQSCPAFL
jgi:hypothetical protein